MITDKDIAVLIDGLKAARKSVFSGAHPHSLSFLYSRAEDKLYELYNAVKDRKYVLVKDCATDIIVIASRIIERAEFFEKVAGASWDTKE
jgi:hypothetical protein